jgi:hypothetical protein
MWRRRGLLHLFLFTIYLTPNDVSIRRFEASNDELIDEQEIQKKKEAIVG